MQLVIPTFFVAYQPWMCVVHFQDLGEFQSGDPSSDTIQHKSMQTELENSEVLWISSMGYEEINCIHIMNASLEVL